MAPFSDSSMPSSAPGARPLDATPRWCLPEIAGHLVELCGGRASASLSLAFRLVHDAQMRGENVAWISLLKSSFFPPDAAECGVDLESFAVVRVPAAKEATFAADLLARSGAFGLIVLDLDRRASVSMAVLSRLLGLARKHEAAIVFLTEKPAEHASLGSLVALRADARRVRELREVRELRQVRELRELRAPHELRELRELREPHEGRELPRAPAPHAEPLESQAVDRFACELRVTKDKRRAFGWSHVEVRRGPDGMR